VGIQNGTLAMAKRPPSVNAITAGLLNNPDMAIPAAIYSLFMYVTGFIAIRYGRKLAATNPLLESQV
jgi:bile acid:Na+ symporter, BASS family